jgi:hypothetical protein
MIAAKAVDYVASKKVGTMLQKIVVGLAILSVFVIGSVQVYTSPKTFTIDAKHWECTDTQPNGIEAECTNFTKKKFSLRAQ